MRFKNRAFYFLAPLLMVFSVVCGGIPLCRAQSSSPHRILFVGNSYTALNGGIDTALRRLRPDLETSKITPNGYTLESHYKSSRPLSEIRSGRWDVVIFQEQSQLPIYNQAKFVEFGQKLAAEVRKAGGRPALLMTWERPDSAAHGVTHEHIAAAYESLGRRFGIRVVPVGAAFQAAQRTRPRITLYSNDGHPTALGTYLAACVVAYSLFGQDIALTEDATLVQSQEDRTFLQEIAKTASYSSSPGI